MRRIYLDNNASTPLDPRVAAKMRDLLTAGDGNPSSLHAFGRALRRRIEDARERIAGRLGADPAELVFCSGATEANNLALYGLAAAAPPARRRILLSPTEHPSVLEPAGRLEKQGFECIFMPIDECGRLRLEESAALLGPDVAFSSLMAVNNETGVVQPVADWALRCRAAAVPLHCDAVQAVGRLPVDFGALGVDVLGFSAHKFHGPIGAGGMLLRRELPLEALLLGGGQERDRRAGTENHLAIAGMALALDLATEEMAERRRKIEDLSSGLLADLRRRIPGLRLNAEAAERWPGTLNLRVPGARGETLLMRLDLAGIAVSLGAACSSGALEPSHVLAAMGLDLADNLASIRVSISARNDADELEVFAAALAASSGSR